MGYGMTGATVVVAGDGWCSNAPSPYLQGSTHTNVLAVEGAVSNVFDVPSPSFVYIDFAVRLPALRDQPPTKEIVPVPHAAFYVNSQSNIVFYHRYFNGDYVAPVWSTNDQVQIPAGEWVRLTVELAYDHYTDEINYGYYMDNFYRIGINGSTNYFTNNLAYSLEYVAGGYPEVSNLSGGPREWFMCANAYGTGPYTLNTFAISGQVQIDDLAVSTNAPSGSSTNQPSTNAAQAVASPCSVLSAPVFVVR